MLIKCIYNKKIHLPKDCSSPSNDPEWDFRLKLGENYIVYAMTIYSGYVWYYVCEHEFPSYPKWKPSPLFEVIDGSISKYWIYSFILDREIDYEDTTWAYPEWANEPYPYYDKLSDGEEEVEIFNKYKELMDLEFPDPSVIETAKILDDEWVLCEQCIDAWQSMTTNVGMIRCPYCKQAMHNPRYKASPRDIESWLEHRNPENK